MNAVEVALEIIQLALLLLKSNPGTTVAETLAQIAGKAYQAYEAHTGQPLDQSLIKPEAPL